MMWCCGLVLVYFIVSRRNFLSLCSWPAHCMKESRVYSCKRVNYWGYVVTVLCELSEMSVSELAVPLQSWRRSLPSLTGPWSWGHAWTAGCTHFGTALPGTACSTPCSRPPGASTTRTPCCARLCTTVYTTAPTGELGQQNPRAPTAPWGLCSSKSPWSQLGSSSRVLNTSTGNLDAWDGVWCSANGISNTTMLYTCQACTDHSYCSWNLCPCSVNHAHAMPCCWVGAVKIVSRR